MNVCLKNEFVVILCFSIIEKPKVNRPHWHIWRACMQRKIGMLCLPIFDAETRARPNPFFISILVVRVSASITFGKRLIFRPWVCHFYCVRPNNGKICCDPIRFHEFPFILFFPHGKFHLWFTRGAPEQQPAASLRVNKFLSHLIPAARTISSNTCIPWVSWSAPPEDTNRLPNKIICEPYLCIAINTFERTNKSGEENKWPKIKKKVRYKEFRLESFQHSLYSACYA